MMRVLVLLIFVVSCASTGRVLYKSELPNVAPKKQLSEVPFILQKDAYCGPATLAMLLNYRGENYSQNELSELTFVEKANGTYQSSMKSAVRKKGYMLVELDSIEDIIKEINIDNPVVVFQNLGFDWYPFWHYSLIVGYDLESDLLTIHSGEEKFKKIEVSKFMKSWKRAGKWGFTAVIPGYESATASELELMKSASILEKLGYTPLARRAYEQIAHQFPDSFMAYVGLGNLSLRDNQLAQSKQYYEKAKEIAPSNPVIHNNLSYINNLIKLQN